MFINGTTYKQSKIPTPTGYLVNPEYRNQVICSSRSNTVFVADGWYNRRTLPKGVSYSDIELKRSLFEAVKRSEVYIWAGDESLLGTEYLAPYSKVKEIENQYIEANEHTTYDTELDQWINYHWNRLSMMKGQNEIVYVFPHSLVYWVSLGFNVVSSGLRDAIVNGELVDEDELEEYGCYFEDDSCDLKSVWEEVEDSNNTSLVLSREPFTVDLPDLYQGDYPKTYVEAESWVNFGSDFSSGEYAAQTFYLPSPVDETNLKALIGRQHDNHVALAYIAKGFSSIGAACSTSESLNRQLFVLFLNSKKYQKFAAFVAEKEGEFDQEIQEHRISFREKLRELAPSLFPFQTKG